MPVGRPGRHFHVYINSDAEVEEVRSAGARYHDEFLADNASDRRCWPNDFMQFVQGARRSHS